MTRSSKSRRLRARAKKRMAKHHTAAHASEGATHDIKLPTLSATDKRYMLAFAIMSFLITVGYWSLGGRNLFVFPAIFCISVGVRRYWAGPVRHYADNN